MSRSSTTGIYTRVDNSFSNPVVGTTISPTDADTFFDDVEASMNSFIAVSTTSLAIGTGTKTFTLSDPSTKVFLANTQIHAFSLADPADFMDCTVTSYDSGTGALVTECFAVGGSGTDADWVILTAGARGATGATGATGSTGATGATVGVQFTYSTTTADADPGAGVFRLNNATVASATAGYFDNSDAGGSSVSAWLDTFDDSTNTAKGVLVARGVTSPTAWAVFAVTGTVVDGTGYRKLTVTYVAGGGTFTNGETFAFMFSRTGDKGADGAGTGDMLGVASSVASEIVLYADAGGKQTARATTTGMLKATAGVLAQAVSGTDYQPPATTLAGYGITDARAQGKETIWMPAAAMTSATTNGAAAGTTEQATNKNMTKTLDFDTTTSEIAQFSIAMPKSWNRGTVTFIPYWTAASGSGTVIWALSGVAISNDDPLDVAFGTAQSSSDTLIAALDNHVGPESAAITIAGTPADGDLINFKIVRDVSDTLGVDAKLIGIKLLITTNAATDA